MSSPHPPKPVGPGGTVNVSADSLAVPDSTVDYARPGGSPEADMRRRWQSGERATAEEYFQRDAALTQDEEAAIDLIYCEFLMRGERGESPTADEYLARFPQYAARLQFLLAFDAAVCDLIRSNSVTQVRITPREPVTPLLEDSPTLIGGKYRIIELLDRGGQGEVYRALHETLRRDVVIKLSLKPASQAAADRDAFLAEGRVLAGLQHPNIAAVYDVDFHQGRPFLAIEYVRGMTVDQYAHSRHPTPLEAAALIARVARAVAAAHRRGVVHRDLKPRNILIDEAGQPRVIDFGLARVHDAWVATATDDAHLSGTLPYMPPEQAREPGAPADARTDIFALGAVLYFLLTDRPLYSGSDAAELIAKARRCAYDRTALDRPSIPPRLRAICLKALAPKPENRYASADEFATALERLLRPSRRAAWIAGIAALVMLAALIPVGWHYAMSTNDNPPSIVIDSTKPTLFVEVSEGKVTRALANVPTPKTGSQMKLSARVPAGIAASLFHIGMDGTITLKGSRRADSAAPIDAPPEAGKSMELIGRDETEMFLVIGGARGPVSLDELRAVLHKAQVEIRLPPLPDGHYLRMMRNKVDWDPIPRLVKDAEAAPQWQARDQLEHVRRALQEFDYFEGVAFTHR
jgi:serine/threonine protein kinase